MYQLLLIDDDQGTFGSTWREGDNSHINEKRIV